jgi:hypothetical protein
LVSTWRPKYAFFHAWADHRRKINTIKKIKIGDGTVLKDIKEISKAFVDFYQELFIAGPMQGVDTCLADMKPCVTEAINAEFLKPFVAEEVVMALGQMHPLKSLGPDGFSACFYQRSWDTVKKEVCKSVLDFLNHGIFDPSINCTHIALIPKIKSPISLTDYRPISLCNVLYKFSSKVLANGLKKVLPHIISPNQSVFIPGRLIMDNIMVAFEAMHTMDKRMKGREGYMALKLDMSKAFDRVEWGFLEAVMQKLGFDARWM